MAPQHEKMKVKDEKNCQNISQSYEKAFYLEVLEKTIITKMERRIKRLAFN